jgi:hypothetical protein
MESAIYEASDSNFFGEYVAACATSSCRYMSESVFVAVIVIYMLLSTPLQLHWSVYVYLKRGLLVQKYPAHGKWDWFTK